MKPFSLALAFWLLAVILMACAPDKDDWRTWPRRGSIPLASDDCATDSCLEHREYILTLKLKGETK